MAIDPQDIEWLLQRDGAEPGIWLMTVEGPEVGTPFRIARNTQDITSRGMTFEAGWFDLEDESDSSDMPQPRLTVPNVEREIGLIVEETSQLTIHFEMVRPSDPDRVVMAWRMMKLRRATVDPLSVTGTISAASFENEPYAPLRISPSDFPGLYR